MRIRHIQHAVARLRAWWWLRPGKAVVIDTETTDFAGEIVEISIVDAATGDVLLDSLVRPQGEISPDATRVHGITPQMCEDAPAWAELWPQISVILSTRSRYGRRLALAYNAPFDRGHVDFECRRHNVGPMATPWRCIMRLDAQARDGRWRRLDAGHRACGDTLAARAVLCAIAGGSRA